jgi:hypothetical protein
MTRSLLVLADRLAELGVTRVVMEATSDYWKGPFYLLEAHGFAAGFWLAGPRRGGFDLTRFHIDRDNQKVICPNGKTSRNWRETHSRQGLPIVQATFRAPDCTPCPDRVRCTRSPVLGPPSHLPAPPPI